MNKNLLNTKTAENLMRAFAGESQARNRYTFAAQFAEQKQQFAISALLKFTANQEKEHAEIFYNHLAPLAEKTIEIDGGYPIDISDSVAPLLRMAEHNEYEEASVVYPAFAKTARDEGFSAIAQDFENIAKIEQAHGERFGEFAKMEENGSLYKLQNPVKWVCLNCGYILESTSAPAQCPVCHKPQGYYIRLEMASWGAKECLCSSKHNSKDESPSGNCGCSNNRSEQS